jgi:hypothetical protein
VDEPMPLSPRLIAGLSSSASAGPIGCTSGLDALELGAFDFGVLRGFLGWSGFFAMAGIWDESDGEKRAKAAVCSRQVVEGTSNCAPSCVVSRCQQRVVIASQRVARMRAR